MATQPSDDTEFTFGDDATTTGQPGVADNGASGGDGDSSGAGGDGSGAVHFGSLGGSGDAGSWRERRDGWDHSVYNAEYHLGPDRRTATGDFRQRKAPPGGSSRTSAGKSASRSSVSVSSIERFLIFTHTLLANATHTPEMELDRDDANNLAVPIADVAKLYDVKVDPRLEAYGTLVMAVAFVYGPKLKAIMERKRGDNARNVTRDAPASNGAAPADDLDFSRMTAGRFH